jgi:ADP-heptose:LPS heptosyltransferase
MCGFKRIVGAPLTHDLQINRPDPDGLVERECQRLARCMADIGPIDLDDPASWDLRLTAAERDEAQATLGPAAGQPRIAINMGGKALENDWGEENWKQLVTRLGRSRSDHALVFVGSLEDAPRATRVGDLWPGEVVNLCGRLSPRVSAAAMAGSRLFVGHDSGPMHLAASIGVPCVAMFGTRDASRKFHPYGEVHRVIHERDGVTRISVERVVEGVDALLDRPAVAPPAGGSPA